ncbi:MAG TPA: putative 2OG-Fe(II) oxygenase [Rhodanobacteraceae bacterium]
MKSAFGVPVVEAALVSCEKLNASLKSLFLRLESTTDTRNGSIPTAVVKVGVYESPFNLFARNETPIQELRYFCLNTLAGVISRLNGYGDTDMRKLRIFAHSWFHLTRHGGYTTAHYHPMASWSGVYCVDPGDAVAGHCNSGAFRILDTRPGAGMYVDPGNSHLTASFALGAVAYFFQPGQLLLFPSYLMHEVSPYLGKRERVTVAFNAWVREAGDAADMPFVRAR